MRINYKNINQTFIKNMKKYAEIKNEIDNSFDIFNVYNGLPIYLYDNFKKKHHKLLDEIELSILVSSHFFSKECIVGTNIIASPLFDGFFKIHIQNKQKIFLAIYNRKTLFFTFYNKIDKKLENFCKKRYIDER